jgi:hypothetical protein
VPKTPFTLIMENLFRFLARKSVLAIIATFEVVALVPSLCAHQDPGKLNDQQGSMRTMDTSDSPQGAWTAIQERVKDMESAVQSENLRGIHDPTMKIRAPIKTLKQHIGMLSGDKGQKFGAALKQLDGSVTDLHSAADNGNQAEAKTALKAVEGALDELKALDPEAVFKNMH